jgi:hypothetical protein
MEARPFIHRKGFYIPTLWLDVLATHAPDHGGNDVTLAEERLDVNNFSASHKR